MQSSGPVCSLLSWGQGCLKDCVWLMWHQHGHGLVQTGERTKHWSCGAELRLWPACLGLGLRAWLVCGSLSAPLMGTLGCCGAGSPGLLLRGFLCPCCWAHQMHQLHVLPHLQWDRVKTCYEIFLHYLQHCAYSHCGVLTTVDGFPLSMENRRVKYHRKRIVGINRQTYILLQPLMDIDVSWSSS